MAGQVQQAMLTACPSSLAAGKTVTPVIQAHGHSMEREKGNGRVCVCVCLCVLSQETVTACTESGAELYYLCQKQLNAWTLAHSDTH